VLQKRDQALPKTTSKRPCTVFIRFPKEHETYFNAGKAFLQASPHHTPFSYEDVEFPEDFTTIKGTHRPNPKMKPRKSWAQPRRSQKMTPIPHCL
jgi:hypothetical protein